MPSNKKVFHHSHDLCGGCLVWWMSGVVDVRCGGCLILHTVWWMSGVVDVCVVDVVQSTQIMKEILLQFNSIANRPRII